MKIFILATVLTLALFANVVKTDEAVNFANEADKQKYTDELFAELEKNVDAKCLPALKRDVLPKVKESAVKHIIRIINGDPIYADGNREFHLLEFIRHSPAFKAWKPHEKTCATSFVNSIGKAIKSAYKACKKLFKPFTFAIKVIKAGK